MAAGRMPHFARIRTEGAWGRLRLFEPAVPRAAWATVATGRTPMVHGIAAPRVARVDGGGTRQPGRAEWQSPPFWQILEAAGRKTITVNWPATVPATAWPGTHIDARFAPPTGPDFSTWAVPRQSVSPPGLLEQLRAVRLHPTEVDGSMLAPFVPELRDIDQYRDASLTRLAVALAGISTVHAAATELIEHQAWDVAAVQYGWLDGIQSAALSRPAGSLYGGVVDTAYAFSDAMLGRLLQLAGPDTTVWVVSSNSVRGGGFIAGRGKWIEAGKTLPPAGLVDIAPSLLARFGLVAETDGKVISALAPGMSKRPVTLMPRTKPAADRHVEALRALGYDDAPSDAGAAALKTAAGYELIAKGEALLAAGRWHEAERSLLAARTALPPDSPAGLQRLALCRLMRNDAEGCRRIGETLLRITPYAGWGDLIVAAGYALDGDAEAARPFMAAAEQNGGDNPDLVNRLGGVALLLKDAAAAAAHFAAALALDPEMEAARQGLVLAGQMAAETASE